MTNTDTDTDTDTDNEWLVIINEEKARADAVRPLMSQHYAIESNMERELNQWKEARQVHDFPIVSESKWRPPGIQGRHMCCYATKGCKWLLVTCHRMQVQAEVGQSGSSCT